MGLFWGDWQKKVRCRFCGHRLSLNGQTTGMLYHITEKHKDKIYDESKNIKNELADINNCLYRFIIEDELSLSTLESYNFKRLVSSLNINY